MRGIWVYSTTEKPLGCVALAWPPWKVFSGRYHLVALRLVSAAGNVRAYGHCSFFCSGSFGTPTVNVITTFSRNWVSLKVLDLIWAVRCCLMARWTSCDRQSFQGNFPLVTTPVWCIFAKEFRTWSGFSGWWKWPNSPLTILNQVGHSKIDLVLSPKFTIKKKRTELAATVCSLAV